MSDKINQHFIPQYALRLFANHDRLIPLLLLGSRTPIRSASIRGQCARRHFYGGSDVETTLSGFESAHSKVIRRLILHTRNRAPLSSDDTSTIRQAILLQRFRTPRHVEMFAAMSDELRRFAFRAFCDSLPDRDVQRYAIRKHNANQIQFKDAAPAIAVKSLNAAITYAPMLSDMRLYILLNRTSTPFYLGDSPAVAYNKYAARFPNRGVLGVNSSGLMLFLPITDAVQVALVDPSVYSFYPDTSPFVDITSVRDVRSLNLLQLSASFHCTFCRNGSHLEEMSSLAQSFSHLLRAACGTARKTDASEWLIDGVHRRGDILHTFERQLPVVLSLESLRYKEATSESQIVEGRHKRSSDTFRQCESIVGPFPEADIPIDIEVK